MSNTESELPTEAKVDDSTESEGEPEVEGRSSSRLRRFAKRLMNQKELADDTRDLLFTLLNTSDKAKTEMIRLAAREFRSYLDEFGMKDLLTSYSLEVKASVHLKPLAETLDKLADDETES